MNERSVSFEAHIDTAHSTAGATTINQVLVNKEETFIHLSAFRLPTSISGPYMSMIHNCTTEKNAFSFSLSLSLSLSLSDYSFHFSFARVCMPFHVQRFTDLIAKYGKQII